MTFRVLDDHAKRRLTSPDAIAHALRLMREQGIDETDLLVELLKMFYVDLDEYSAVVRAA